MAGLAAGGALRSAGWRVTVLDKGRVAGGRMATRTFDEGRFDYGAQFFTLRDEAFAELARPWVEAGQAVPWTEHRMRVPGGMRTIAELMAEELDVRLSQKVVSVREAADSWEAITENGDRFAAGHLLLTAPVPQSVELLSASRVELDEIDWALLDRAQYWKCITVLARIDGRTKLGEDGFAAPESGAVKWVADNYAKGVSRTPGYLTIHATREFSEDHWERPASEVVDAMLGAAAGCFDGRVRSYYLHRWRYAEPATQMPTLFHAVRKLVFAGDVFGGPRVGGAAASGLAAAAHLLRAERTGT
jgi:renalase